jgi:hypothetical protein
MCGKHRSLSPLDLEVWQRKGLRADFADVWQVKELEGEKEVEEGTEVEDANAGKRTDEAVRKRRGVSPNSAQDQGSRLILRRAERQRNWTKVQKCIPVLLRGGRPEIHARTKLGGELDLLVAVGRIDGRRRKSRREESRDRKSNPVKERIAPRAAS